MDPQHGYVSPGGSFIGIVLGVFLAGCVGAAPPGGEVLEGTPTDPVADPSALPAPTERLPAEVGVDRPGSALEALAPRCQAIAELSDPRRGSSDRSAFELQAVTVAGNARRTACVAAGQDGADFALRFVAPTTARWRFLVTSPQAGDRWNMSVLEGCGDTGALLRCQPYASSVVAALTAGSAVTLVVDGVVADRRLRVRAERVEPWGTAPQVRQARAYRWMRESFAMVDVRDEDQDLSLVMIELRDARGGVVPLRGLARWELRHPARQGGETRFWLGDLPESAVSARVWAEDETGAESLVSEVPIEPRPTVPVGGRCDALSQESVCEVGALCIYDRGTGRFCRARLEARYDATARALRVDLNAAGLGLEAAQVVLLNDAGGELERTERFRWVNRSSEYSLDRTELLARDQWDAPAGLARVRVAVIDGAGRTTATLEAPVQAPVVTAAWQRCDPLTTARVRCAEALVCVSTPGESAHRTCQRRDPGCPRDWRGRRWEPSAGAGVAAFEGTAATEYHAFPPCMRESVWTGATAREDVIDFVAPTAGSYRFQLTDRATRATRHWDFGISAQRAVCSAERPAPVLACSRAGDTTGRLTLSAVIDVVAAAGEHIPLLVTSRRETLDYRLEVTPPGR